MAMKKVTIACAECVQALGKRLDALGDEVSEGKKAVIFSLTLRLSRLEFVLTTKNSFMCPPGTLFVRIFPMKNRPLSLHLYELMAKDDFRCVYFPYNCTPEQLRYSFDVLTDLVLEFLPAVEALALDIDAYESVLQEKCRRLAETGGMNMEELPDDLPQSDVQRYLLTEWGEYYETFYQLLPFTQDEAYAAFVAGNRKKARKKYRKAAKKGKLQPYFQRLYAFLETPEAEGYAALPEMCTAAYLGGREQQYGTREGLKLFPMAGVCYGVLLLLFFLVLWVLHCVLCAGTVWSPFDPAIVLTFPLLPAVFGAISLRRWLRPRLFRRDSARWLAQDAAENTGRVNTVCHVLFGLLTVVCLLFGVVLTMSAPRFYRDRMVYDDGAAFPLPAPVTYAYEEIDRVCYIGGRWNVFDELVERGSYVLVFTDGQAIDLDSTISKRTTEAQVLPLLEPYIEDIIPYPSDRELAAAYGKTPDAFFGYE